MTGCGGIGINTNKAIFRKTKIGQTSMPRAIAVSLLDKRQFFP
jgi:hypothetical protein